LTLRYLHTSVGFSSPLFANQDSTAQKPPCCCSNTIERRTLDCLRFLHCEFCRGHHGRISGQRRALQAGLGARPWTQLPDPPDSYTFLTFIHLRGAEQAMEPEFILSVRGKKYPKATPIDWNDRLQISPSGSAPNMMDLNAEVS
ncbi:hypothetical protein J4Q44_G00110620, partial [Coregonus suidteri]